MKLLNALDVQARVQELVTDVSNAIACEIADWEYDEFLARNAGDDELDTDHADYISRLESLKTELQWYENIKYRHNHRRS